MNGYIEKASGKYEYRGRIEGNDKYIYSDSIERLKKRLTKDYHCSKVIVETKLNYGVGAK